MLKITLFTCMGECVQEVTEQLMGVGPFLVGRDSLVLLCGSWGLNLGHQIWHLWSLPFSWTMFLEAWLLPLLCSLILSNYKAQVFCFRSWSCSPTPIQYRKLLRTAVLSLWVMTLLGVYWPFHRGCLSDSWGSDIYIAIPNSSRITVMTMTWQREWLYGWELVTAGPEDYLSNENLGWESHSLESCWLWKQRDRAAPLGWLTCESVMGSH